MTLLMCLSTWRFLRGDATAGAAEPERRVVDAETAAPLGAARL
jgi:hypothetical protein